MVFTKQMTTVGRTRIFDICTSIPVFKNLLIAVVSPQNKQMELGDKMDLASYLLKPIQRMSKYALLLKDLIKECSQSQEQELSDLRTAEDMVKFQLRHGNDLLAMDAIRGCDVSSDDRHVTATETPNATQH